MAMLISMVVPCYNEEDALPLFKARFDEATAGMDEARFELLLVDDGSRDGTLSLCHRLAGQDARVRVLSLARNSGKEAALLAGLSHARGDLIAVMDADLQDPPELLCTMYDTLRRTGCDCVASRRVTRVGEPPVRSFFARLFYRLMRRLSEVAMEDGVRDFRLMRREMLDAILRLPEKRRFSKGLFAWVGFDVRYLAYENVERVAGVTKWSFWNLLAYAVEGIVSLTTAPLAVPFGFSLLCAAAALVLACCGQGFPALLCLLACLALVSCGIAGAYVARIFWEAKRRPLYVLRRDTPTRRPTDRP